MATIRNRDVNDYGSSMLPGQQQEKARQRAAATQLDLFHYIDSERRGTYTHEELSQMFATMLEDAGSITDSFDHNYNRWIEYMTVAYIVHLKRSELRPEVNRQLGDLIEQINL